MSNAEHSPASALTLSTYRLVFDDDEMGVAKVVEFEARDAAKALEIASTEAAGRSTELWRSGKWLCNIVRKYENCWLVV